MADDDRQTSMQFCPECNNLMYPKEVFEMDNPKKSRLVYVCKAPNCQNSQNERDKCQNADSTLVWKHVIKHQMMTDEIVHNDITQDPTLPRTREINCPKCHNREAVYLQVLTGPQEGISLYFICCSCNNTWTNEGGETR